MFHYTKLFRQGVQFTCGQKHSRNLKIRHMKHFEGVWHPKKVIKHDDSQQNIGVSADTSVYCLGAVLSLTDESWIERPVYIACKVLYASERKYSQIEKQGLAIGFSLKHFKPFLTLLHFTLHTNNRPLLKIFRFNDSVQSTTSARLRSWAILIGCFDNSIGYKKSAVNANAADCRVFQWNKTNQLISMFNSLKLST